MSVESGRYEVGQPMGQQDTDRSNQRKSPVGVDDTAPTIRLGGWQAWFEERDTQILPPVGLLDDRLSTEMLSTIARPTGTQRTGRNIAVALIGRLAQYGIALPLSIISSRLLGPHDKGTYTIFLLVSIVFTYCTFGASSAAIYAVGRKVFTLRQAVGNVVSLGLLISAITAAGYFVLAFVLRVPFLLQIPTPYRALLILLGPIVLLNYFLSDCQLAANDIIGYNIANIVQVVVQAAGFGALLVVSQDPLNAAVFSYWLSVIASLLSSLLLLMRFTAVVPSWRGSIQRELLRFGAQTYLTSLFNYGNVRLDTYLVSIFVSVTAVGYYAVSASVSELLWQLPLVLSTVLFPAAAAASARGGARLIATVCRRSLFLIALLVVVVFAAGHLLIVILYGPAFLPALVPLWLLLPGAFGVTIYKSLYSYLLGNNKAYVGIISTGASLAVTITLDLLLIPRYGIAGAALTSSIAYCLNGAIVLVAFLAYGHVRVDQALFVRPSDLRALGIDVLRAVVKTWRLLQDGRAWLQAHRAMLLALLAGATLGTWVAVVMFDLSAIAFVLACVGALAALALFDRLWLVAAIVVADLTLTDYPTPLLPSQSLRTVLAALVLYGSALAIAQRRFALSRDSLRLAAVLSAFVAIGLLSNTVNGGDTSTFVRHTAVGIVLLFTLAGVLDRKRRLLVVLVPALLILSLSALTALAQVYLASPIGVADTATLARYTTRGFGLTQIPVNLSDTLGVGAATLIGIVAYGRMSLWLRCSGAALALVLIAGIYSSGTRSGFLAVGLACVVVVLGLPRSQRYVGLAFLFAATAGAAIVVVRSGAGSHLLASRASRDLDISTGQRVALWLAGLLIVRDHPLLGIGYNRFLGFAPRYTARVASIAHLTPGSLTALGTLPPHNDFLAMWIAFGTLGAVAFALLHAFGFWSAWRTWRRTRDPWLRAVILGLAAGLAAYCANAFVHNAYDDSLLLWVLLGLILALDKLSRVQRQTTSKTSLAAIAPALDRTGAGEAPAYANQDDRPTGLSRTRRRVLAQMQAQRDR